VPLKIFDKAKQLQFAQEAMDQRTIKYVALSCVLIVVGLTQTSALGESMEQQVQAREKLIKALIEAYGRHDWYCSNQSILVDDKPLIDEDSTQLKLFDSEGTFKTPLTVKKANEVLWGQASGTSKVCSKSVEEESQPRSMSLVHDANDSGAVKWLRTVKYLFGGCETIKPRKELPTLIFQPKNKPNLVIRQLKGENEAKTPGKGPLTIEINEDIKAVDPDSGSTRGSQSDKLSIKLKGVDGMARSLEYQISRKLSGTDDVNFSYGKFTNSLARKFEIKIKNTSDKSVEVCLLHF